MIAGYFRLFVVFGIPTIIIYLIVKSSKSKKEKKNIPNNKNKINKSSSNVSSNNTAIKKGYTTHFDSLKIATTEFNVAGVTFKDGRLSRQAALRKLKFQDPPMDGPIDFEFEDYEYNNSPAILIKANDRIIGNVPADLVNEFIELRGTCSGMELHYRVSGGGDYSFGCKMIITWRFD